MSYVAHGVPLPQYGAGGILRSMPLCVVSYVDTEGFSHSVEVQAEGLYEAAVLGLAAFAKHDCQPGEVTRLDIEVRSKITHTISAKKVHQWLESGGKSPKEMALKARLRSLL